MRGFQEHSAWAEGTGVVREVSSAGRLRKGGGRETSPGISLSAMVWRGGEERT